jgi:hypothetical protein
MDGGSVFHWLNAYVAEGTDRACAMPVAFAGSEPDAVARTNLSHIAAGSLDETDPIQHEQKLAARVTVPVRRGSWLEVGRIAVISPSSRLDNSICTRN